MNAPANPDTARRIIPYPLEGPTLISPTDSMSTALFKATCIADFLAVLAEMESLGEIDFSGEQARRMCSGRALIVEALAATLNQLTDFSDQSNSTSFHSIQTKMTENMSDQAQDTGA